MTIIKKKKLHQSVQTNGLNKQFFTLFFFLPQNDFVVETNLVGTVLNGLSHLNAVMVRGQFIIGLLRGFGGNLNLKTRQEFAKEVSTLVRRFLSGWDIMK